MEILPRTKKKKTLRKPRILHEMKEYFLCASQKVIMQMFLWPKIMIKTAFMLNYINSALEKHR